MSSGFRSIPSTEQRLEGVERKLDQVVAKLDMILDSMTKPTQVVGPPTPITGEFTFAVPKSKIAPEVMDAINKAAEPMLKTEEPRRMSGKPAKVQIEEWIRRNFKTLIYFKKAAEFGLVIAKVEKKSAKANATHRYTHRIKFSGSFPESFNPTVFGQRELDEVIVYLESLGVHVKTSSLERV